MHHHRNVQLNAGKPSALVTVTQVATPTALFVDSASLKQPNAHRNVLRNVEKLSIPVTVTHHVTNTTQYVGPVPLSQLLSCRVATSHHQRVAGASHHSWVTLLHSSQSHSL